MQSKFGAFIKVIWIAYLAVTIGSPKVVFADQSGAGEARENSKKLNATAVKMRKCLAAADRKCLKALVHSRIIVDSSFDCGPSKLLTSELFVECAFKPATGREKKSGQKLMQVLDACYAPSARMGSDGASFITERAYQCNHVLEKGELKLESVFLTD